MDVLVWIVPIVLVLGLVAWWAARTGAVRAKEIPAALAPRTEAVRAAPEEEQPEPRPSVAPTASPAPAPSRFLDGLRRSREELARRLAGVLGKEAIDDDVTRKIEEALISADVGARVAADIARRVRERAESPSDVPRALREELKRRLGAALPIAAVPSDGPLVVFVVGVNGSGKTTTIGKLAARYRESGATVVVAAGDTYRAGAIEQLRIWSERAGAGFVERGEGADPASVAFDAVKEARAVGAGVVICDTAGRLQADRPLMDQLAKMVRVVGKAQPGAPHEVLLVLDATIGQNALSQARDFKEAAGVTGVALTKLDGTAKGGVVVAVREETGLPVKLVGLGEGISDLRDFDCDEFVDGFVA